MKKIVTVLGARPQFIKASVVSHAMRQSGQLQEVLIHTGQHFDANMSDVFFEELGMHKPDHFLDIHGGGHGAMTGRMLEQVENVLLAEKPVAVLVYGAPIPPWPVRWLRPNCTFRWRTSRRVCAALTWPCLKRSTEF